MGMVAASSQAALVVFSGADSGANSTDPRPLSDAAASAFDAAAGSLGSLNVINFESTPLGSFSSQTVAPGVTLSGTNPLIVDAPYSTPDSLFGYNTTVGGTHFAQFFGGSMTFTFATPIHAFGTYLTGVQLDHLDISFDDGSAQSIPLVNVGSGAQFLGFTDAGKSISSLTINMQTPTVGDVAGMDDVRYGAVPEPTTMATVGLGIAALLRRRRKA